MPVMLDGSNININYSTSNFDIQSVKSELYIPDTTNNSGNIINVPIGMNETIKQPLAYEPMNTNIIFEDFTFKTEEIRTFTHDGSTNNQTSYNLNIPHDIICDILIVGGGGGGGYDRAGGGGAGGLLLYEKILLKANTYNINVGKGGLGRTSYSEKGQNGFSSSISGSFSNATIFDTALGGGGGATADGASVANAGTGGSGGGGSGNVGWTANAGGIGTTGQGFNGGNSGGLNSGGGGGAGAAGSNGVSGTNSANSGNGGIGRNMSSYFGTSVGQSGWFAGGGGGALNFDNFSTAANSTSSRGGQGGGGNAGLARGQNGSDGLANTGSGGGGGANIPQGSGGKGGSGIVIIKFIKVVNAVAPEEIRTFTHNGSAENQTIYNLNIEQDVVCDSRRWWCWRWKTGGRRRCWRFNVFI
jgi:hypothetical protein